MPGTIDLLLPGLFDLPAEYADAPGRLPGLGRILRFARTLANRAHSIDACVAEMLQIPLAEGEFRGLPVAPALAAAAAGADHVLFAPVYLRPDMQRAIVLPIGRDSRDVDETRRLVADLAREFYADFECREVTPGAYLMRLGQLQAPDCYPHPLSVFGKPANPYIEPGRAGLAWYRLLTEIQMYLHQHPVNGERLARGAAPINSLWFWGAGEKAPRPGRLPAWYCDDPVLRRFGQRLGLECRGPDLLASAAADIALVELRPLEWLKTGTEGDLWPLLEEIDSRLLLPSVELVRRRRMTLRLRSASETDLRLGPWSLRCIWRRRRPDFSGLAAGSVDTA